MVTELFDTIPQSTGSGATRASKRGLPLSPINPISSIPRSGNLFIGPEQAVITSAVHGTAIQALSPSIMLDAREIERRSSIQSSLRTYQPNYSNILTSVNSVERLPTSFQPVNSTAQVQHGIHQHQSFLPQNGYYGLTHLINTSKIVEENEIDGTNRIVCNTVADDKSKVIEVGTDGFEEIQFLTDILQNSINEQSQKEATKSVHASTIDELRLDSMDTLYEDVNQYSSNQTSFEIYKDEDMTDDTEKTNDQGIMGSCSWDTSSSASSASSIGSHFDFPHSQDFSDMMSDFGVSDIDWGTVDMIRI